MSDTDPPGRPADAEPSAPAPQQDPSSTADDPPMAAGVPPEAALPPPPAAPSPTEPEPAPSPGAAAAPVPAAPVASTGDDAGGEGRKARRRLAALCIALFVLSVGLALLAATLASRLEDERNRHQAVEEVSGRFATALLTYTHENLDEAKQRVLALSTGKFRREYEQAFTAGLDVLIRETKATSSGTVTDVFVGSVEDDTATAIVVANAVSEGTSGTRRTVASYIQLELVRVSGAWRIDGVTNLNFGQNSGGGAVPTAPTAPTSTPPE